MKSDLFKYLLGAILALGVMFGAGFEISNQISNQKLKTLLEYQEITHAHIVVERNKVQSLNGLVAKTEEEKQELLQLLASVKEPPAEIRYVVRTETVLQPQDPVYITAALPDNHLFVLEPGLTVGEFATENDTYRFETYPLSFKTSIVLGERNTAVLLQASSQYDGEWYDILTDVTTTRISPHKAFRPTLGLGVWAGLPNPSTGASVHSSFIHPSPVVSLLGVQAGFNTNSLHLGLEPFSYNLGDPLPVLTDLWIAPAITYDTNGVVGGTLSLHTRL